MAGNSLAALIIKLERRIIVLEKALGITPKKESLVHPKSLKIAELKNQLEEAIK